MRRINPGQASHLVPLIEWIGKTKGDVLELGIGMGSTPILHELCRDRKLISYENDLVYFNQFIRYESPWHEMKFVQTWAEAEMERPWALAFVDSASGPSRPEAIERLRNWADYIMVHDTEKRNDRHYHMKDVLRSFKYRMTYKGWEPYTSVVSDKCTL